MKKINRLLALTLAALMLLAWQPGSGGISRAEETEAAEVAEAAQAAPESQEEAAPEPESVPEVQAAPEIQAAPVEADQGETETSSTADTQEAQTPETGEAAEAAPEAEETQAAEEADPEPAGESQSEADPTETGSQPEGETEQQAEAPAETPVTVPEATEIPQTTQEAQTEATQAPEAQEAPQTESEPEAEQEEAPAAEAEAQAESQPEAALPEFTAAVIILQGTADPIYYGDQLRLIAKVSGANREYSLAWQSLDPRMPEKDRQWRTFDSREEIFLEVTGDTAALRYRVALTAKEDGAVLASGEYTMPAPLTREEAALAPETINDESQGTISEQKEDQPVPQAQNTQTISTWRDALNPDRAIDVYFSWEDGVAALGNEARFTAVLTGYENLVYALQWQQSGEDGVWTDIPGAEGDTYLVTVTEENCRLAWRVQVTITDARSE